MLELARVSDWEAVKRLSVQIHDLHAKWRPDIYYHAEEPYSKEEFLSAIENKSIYVAKLADTVVGYATLSFREMSGPGVVEKKVMCLNSICVDETLRGHGIGKEMVRDIRALCRAFGCRDIMLSVHPENDEAVVFYQKCGFHIRTIHMDTTV
jgi:ribosomal protein S18 acetylase RimI-like enzyme